MNVYNGRREYREMYWRGEELGGDVATVEHVKLSLEI
jgi:hypothetical protein